MTILDAFEHGRVRTGSYVNLRRLKPGLKALRLIINQNEAYAENETKYGRIKEKTIVYLPMDLHCDFSEERDGSEPKKAIMLYEPRI